MRWEAAVALHPGDDRGLRQMRDEAEHVQARSTFCGGCSQPRRWIGQPPLDELEHYTDRDTVSGVAASGRPNVPRRGPRDSSGDGLRLLKVQSRIDLDPDEV
jgi:hypothetical protein